MAVSDLTLVKMLLGEVSSGETKIDLVPKFEASAPIPEFSGRDKFSLPDMVPDSRWNFPFTLPT